MIQNKSRLKVTDNTGAREVLVMGLWAAPTKNSNSGRYRYRDVKSAAPQGAV